MVVRQAAAVVSRAESRTSVGGWSPESRFFFYRLSRFKSYNYILRLNINRLWSFQCFSRSDSNMICIRSAVLHIRVTALTHSVCPIFLTLVFFSHACFVCHLRLLFSAAACVHGALLPFKMLQPSKWNIQKQRRPSSDCSRAEDWRRGIAQEGREGLEDRVARQTRITWAQICLQTETVRPGKTQEPSWRILLAGLRRTHL